MLEITYGQFLACARKRANMSQEMLAERVNCAVSTISRIENGIERPHIRLFEAIDDVFGGLGFEYDEIAMEGLFSCNRAKNELLVAIAKERSEVLERKIDKFHKYMECDNDEHIQHYVLGHLGITRHYGMPLEKYLEENITIYESVRSLPELDEIHEMKLRKIEYVILWNMGKTYIELGELKKAKKIFIGLTKNPLNNHYILKQERFIGVAQHLAQINALENNYDKSLEFLSYGLGELLESDSFKLLANHIDIQQEICRAKNDVDGINHIELFSKAARNLSDYFRDQNKR